MEQPHETLKYWAGLEGRGRTLVVIGEGIGIGPVGDASAGHAEQLFKDRKLDDLLQPGYPVARDKPINSQNFLSFAFREGLIGKVYWVPPTIKPVGEEPFVKFKEFIRGMGIGDADLASLLQKGDSITGKLNGIPVHISSLKGLPKIRDDVLLLLDISYFAQIYGNEVKTPFLELFGGFMEDLGGKGLKVSQVVVSYSTSSDVPLALRFIGGYLKTYFQNPSSLGSGPPRTWLLRAQAMYYSTFFQPDEMAQYYSDAVKLDPQDASLRYELAKTFFLLKDLQGVREELAEAVALDKGYYPEYIETGRYFMDNKMPEDALYFLGEARRVNPQDPRPLELLYDLHNSRAEYNEAAEALDAVKALGFMEPSLLGALGEAYMKSGNLAGAEENLKEALKQVPAVDKKERYPYVLRLGETYEQSGKMKEAIECYTEALDGADTDADRSHISEKIRHLKETWAPFLSPPS